MYVSAITTKIPSAFCFLGNKLKLLNMTEYSAVLEYQGIYFCEKSYFMPVNNSVAHVCSAASYFVSVCQGPRR